MSEPSLRSQGWFPVMFNRDEWRAFEEAWIAASQGPKASYYTPARVEERSLVLGRMISSSGSVSERKDAFGSWNSMHAQFATDWNNLYWPSYIAFQSRFGELKGMIEWLDLPTGEELVGKFRVTKPIRGGNTRAEGFLPARARVATASLVDPLDESGGVAFPQLHAAHVLWLSQISKFVANGYQTMTTHEQLNGFRTGQESEQQGEAIGHLLGILDGMEGFEFDWPGERFHGAWEVFEWFRPWTGSIYGMEEGSQWKSGGEVFA